MSEPHLIARERELLHDLLDRVAERSVAEVKVEADYRERTEAARKEFETARERVMTRYKSDRHANEKEVREARQRIVQQYREEATAAANEFNETKRRVTGRSRTEKEKAKSEFQESRWTSAALFEAGKTGAERQYKDVQSQATAGTLRLQALDEEAQALLLGWGAAVDATPLPTPSVAATDPAARLKDTLARAETQVQELKALLLPWLVQPRLYFGLVFLFAALAAAAAWLPTQSLAWTAGVGLGLVAVAAGLRYWLAYLGRKEACARYAALRQVRAEGEALCQQWRDQATATYKRLRAEIRERHDTELRQALEKYRKLRADSKQRRDTDLRRALDRYRKTRTEARQRRDTTFREAVEKYRARRADLKANYDRTLHAVHDRYYRTTEESKARYEQEWQTTITRWREGRERVHAAAAEVAEANERYFPAWDSPVWHDWMPPRTVPPVVRFGEFLVNLADIPGGTSQDPRLQLPLPDHYKLPAFLEFPTRSSLLLKASDAGRAVAVQLLQAVMMRLLTAVPPGKVRFTIIDPVGLGENFATFMHLADHDEQLVASKIWTEQHHIEQRLIDLTAHMEVVIQKYLRNQYETIEEYNAQAGEVAEPFRILVVANFPASFSPEAGRRLVSIVNSGARCGVYTLLSVDTKQTPPQGFNLKDLEPHCLNLVWKDQRFVWKDADFGTYPLRLEAPPDAEFATRLLHQVGARAKEASRVEVPFEFIAPEPAQWWTGTTRPGIDVPLGRAGATKRQHLRLGQGTSQHVLVAGKTGSGKSTLLHALITNAALSYSPDELELYLIDFKKGVEFKTYATEGLPHARVVAIESEREFGLSVLQRLDAELRQRGERFRAAGVQDLAGFRQADSSTPMPRILLIVDEFQEFFVEDDKVSQEAAQLLDRLVRQGRAFGLHVLLGSQTLGGAFSLARSTIDQMAVRIALQCSEADGHLILSETNSAARLLSRPGEAIYNDANGLVEGNNPFQVVWLGEERRETYLRQIHTLGEQRPHHARRRAQIVFEGNAPADVYKNDLLNALLAAPGWPESPRSARAWLGEAMAIKDPTAALFRRLAGSNLVLVGQDENAALGILTTALVSLAAQYAPGNGTGVRFYVLDGTPPDSPHDGYLAGLAGVVPHSLRVAGWREVADVIAEVADEVDRRQKTHDVELPPVYLFLNGIQRFRDLRRQEDDVGFSFSRRGEERPSASRQFATLLREGAGLGVHVLLWSDSLNNLQRAVDRQGMREFEMRVLFQMSVADSSNLIDSPAASKLGVHRAIYYSEEQGRLEKFRPYGVPPPEWLERVKQQLTQKGVAVQA